MNSKMENRKYPTAEQNITEIRDVIGQALDLHDGIQLRLFRNHQQIQQKNMQIARERKRFMTLFNLAPIGFLVINEENYILECNVACAIQFVIPSRIMVGKNLGTYIASKDKKFFYDHRQHMRQGEKRSFEITMCTSLGRHFYARLETTLTREKELFVTIADISNQKKMMDDLSLAKDELQALCGQLRSETIQRQQAEEELRKFTRKLIEVQEEERERIAQELHDNVGQLMTYLGLLLDKARTQMDSSIYRDAKSVAREVLIQIRDLSSDLQPSLLRSVGLRPSLIALYEKFHEMTGIQVLCQFENVDDVLSGDSAVTAYRIIQEALTNVGRHAQVHQAQVRVGVREDRIEICVQDLGIGFEVSSTPNSIGLTGMKERSQAIGGSLAINSMPGQGTTILADLPLLQEPKSPAHSAQ
jgi:signal transduction histidine kinase